ncbi:HD-GYP domain-containing protein [Chloroflexota bacterium]
MLIGGAAYYIPSLGLTKYPLGIIGNILFCVLFTLAVLRCNLLEMKMVLRKGATYSLLSMLIFGIFGSLILLLSRTFQALINPLSLIINIGAIFIIAAVFQPLLVKLQRVMEKLFFHEGYDHIQALKRFTEGSKGKLDLKQLSASLVAAVANSMQSCGVYLLLSLSPTGDFKIYSYCGSKSIGRLSLSASSLLTTTMSYRDIPLDASDMDVIHSLNSLFESEKQCLVENGIELLVPLKYNDRLVGILLLGNKASREPYFKEDRQLLQAMADRVAMYIDNASRYQRMRGEHGELQKAMDGVVYAVSLVVETRDPYTAGHQRRVAELARTLAREMGLSEWQRMGIYIAGLLHDVGKIAVPAEILSKPGKISDYEFNIIKNHPHVGHEILKKIEFPWPVAQAILQHHERMNGTGYPEGLSGEDINLEAKILAVADVVEAMSSHRPYRPALGLDSALSEVSQKSGVLYDPEVVEACLRLFRDDRLKFDRLMDTAANNKHAYNQIEEAVT